MINSFGHENSTEVTELRQRLDSFYSSTKDYTAFHEANSKPEFWQPIKANIQDIIEQTGSCRILEFGAGCTGFGDYLQALRQLVIFDVQDVTASNEKYLLTQADHVYIGDVCNINNQYDIIFSTFVWEHITNPKAVINHLLNLLNTGGSLFIVSPRYDFPFYLSPSAKHLSLIQRFYISIWIQWRRLLVLSGGEPDFLLHFEPAILYCEWFRDADAIHWVSLWDLKRHLPTYIKLERLRIPVTGFRSKIWEEFLLLFVRIHKPKN
jgi:SAM-dependent methyltransferase